MRWESPTEGRTGVPLRFPRPVIPVIAIGMAAVWVAAGSAPAFADQVRSQEFWLSQLNVSQAWQANQGTGITVAVLSDGIDAQHADLAGIVTSGPDFTGTGSAPAPVGTEAASLIAGRGTGPAAGSGIVGVAPKAHILSVRVTLDPADTALDSTATGAALPGAIAQGIRYAVNHGAKVIDLPSDPGRPNPNAIAALPVPRFATEAPQLNGILAAEGGSAAEQQAVAFALSRGVVLVAPAGDNALGTDAPNFPAAYPHVISVGAIDGSFNRGPFSSNQPYVSVLAPGVGVTAASSAGGYTTVSSTTAASALVSGVAALIEAQYPKLTPLQVQQAITTSTAIKPAGGQAPGSGTGSVDAGRAMLAAAALAAPLSDQAGAKAQPLASPPVPAAVPVSDSLAPRLVRAALIALAVLALLIGAILWYRRQGRRREQDSARATADWARSTQNAFSAYGPGDNRTEADRMLEYFAAPSSNPTPASRSFATAAGTLTTNRGGGHSSGHGGGHSGAETAETPAGGLGAWASVAPAPKTQSRQARVSGTPPWEPASQPASELPWAAVPGTVTGGRSAAPSGTGTGSDSIWPVTPATAAASSTSQSWEELAAGTSADRAQPATEPAPPPTPDWDGPAADSPKTGDLAFGGAGFPAASFPAAGFPAASRPVRADPASTGHAMNGTPDAPEPSGSPDASPWNSVSMPRSPSGSNWEALDSGPADGSAAADEASWPKAQDDDAYRASPAGDDAWQPAALWQPADTAAQWQPQTHPEEQAPAADVPWPSADSGPQWQPGESTPQWQPGESTPQWLAAESAPQWQAAESSTAWPAAGGDSWPTSDPGGPQWQGSPAAPWEPAPAATGWALGAGSNWEPGQAPGEPAPEAAEPFDWRPARRTEGFPPAGEED
jgi:subtilisin family serine protease